MANDVKTWLQEGRNVSELVLDCIFDGVYIVDKKRQIVFWNKAAENMTGHLKAAVQDRWCGDNILNHIDENGILLCRGNCPLQHVIQTGEPHISKVYPRKSNGQRFPTETHIAPLVDEDGNILGAIEVFRDISIQEDYRILQEKFNSLIKRYVSSTTFADIQSRLHNESEDNTPRILDMSVLYLDIVNFTGYSEQTPPHEVVEMLNDLFGICEVITRECYGDIDKFIGDAVMAVFADANDAIACAGRILKQGLPGFNAIREQEGKQPMSVRVGINSGPVLQGDIGALERRDLTVIGDTVNVASRIEKQAPHNRLLVSEATLSRLSNDNHKLFSQHGIIEVRGKSTPLHLYIMTQEEQ